MSRPSGRNPREAHARVTVASEYYIPSCPQCQETFARSLWSWWWMQCGLRDCPGCVFLEFEDSPFAQLSDHE